MTHPMLFGGGRSCCAQMLEFVTLDTEIQAFKKLGAKSDLKDELLLGDSQIYSKTSE